MDAGDDGLGKLCQRHHHAAAPLEEGLLEGEIGVRAHFLQVVARAEGLARAGDDEDAGGFVLGDISERRLEFGQEFLGEGVELLRAVESQRDHAAGVFMQ